MYTAAGVFAFIGLLVILVKSIEAGTQMKNPFSAFVQLVWCLWILWCMILLVGMLRFVNGTIPNLSGTGF